MTGEDRTKASDPPRTLEQLWDRISRGISRPVAVIAPLPAPA
jgi:hypothetical protein